jgi:nucleotide-binding universal stress UspA family protein
MRGDDVFEKILVPLDGSEHSTKALSFAIEIARKFGGKLTLVHVYSVVVTTGMMYEPTSAGVMRIPVLSDAEVSRLVQYARETGNRILAEGEQRVSAEKVEVDSILTEGRVVEEISRVAKEGRFDLIVIGARGVSHIREILLGSVTEGLMHHVSCPILVVK